MFLKSFLFPLSISILYCTVHQTETIVNGNNALLEEFPFITSLRNNSGNHYCGGSLVTRKRIVTAAHCAYDDATTFFDATPTKLKPQDIKVLVGTLSTKQYGDTYEVETIIVHPNYNIKAELFLVDDIAIIILKKEVNTANMKPIPLSISYPYIYFSMFIYFSLYLYVNGSGVCFRDSGSSLIVNKEFVGIVSFGVPCGKGVADLYTSVLGYRDFITNIINP